MHCPLFSETSRRGPSESSSGTAALVGWIYLAGTTTQRWGEVTSVFELPPSWQYSLTQCGNRKSCVTVNCFPRGPDCDLCDDSETQDYSSGHRFSLSCASKTSFTTMPSLDVRDLKEVQRFGVSVFDSLFTQTFFSV